MMNKKLSMTFLLLAMLFGVCFSKITWTSQKLSNGKTAYYSAHCMVNSFQITSLGSSLNTEVTSCIPVCDGKGANVFETTTTGCFCYKRDKAVVPNPFAEIDDSTSPRYCGCIEAASAGK